MTAADTELALLSDLLGREVVSRATADKLGPLRGVVIDSVTRKVIAWQVGTGRKSRFAAHEHLTGTGSAAFVLDEEASLHPAATPEEESAAKGHASWLGARVLDDAGNSIGPVDDVQLDPASGVLAAVRVSSGGIAADRILGFGSYALVVATSSP